MSVTFDVLTCLGARDLHPWVGFEPSLSHSRLDACGPMAHLALGDLREQPMVLVRGRRGPLCPQLYRVLEAQAARVHACVAGGLRHQQPDHVVGHPIEIEDARGQSGGATR